MKKEAAQSNPKDRPEAQTNQKDRPDPPKSRKPTNTNGKFVFL